MNLKIQPDKCKFLPKEQTFPQATNKKQIKSFLGRSGCYKRFIINCVKPSKPLTRLLQKDVIFNFQIKDFELKDALVSSPIISYPNFQQFLS